MADIKISELDDLPGDADGADVFPINNSGTTYKGSIAQVTAGLTYATEPEARAGTATGVVMDCLQVANAIDELTTGSVIGPGSTTENNVPQWDSTDNQLKDGLGVGSGSGGLLRTDGDGSSLTGLPSDNSLFQKVDITTPCFTKTAAQTLSIKAGTRIAAGGTVHYWASDTAVTMPTHSSGTDYSIWLKTDGTLESVEDSFGSPAVVGDLTAPTAGAVKVGGYHYGLVGPTETVAGGSFSTSGVTSAGGSFGWTQTDVDKIKGINEFTIWDDTFKCAGQQRGMTFDPIMKMWAAIYFMSDDPGSNGPSAYNTNVGSGTVLPYIPSTWGGDGSTKYARLATFEANELVSAFGLRLPRFEEFMSFAFGVTEGQSLGGASSTVPLTKREPGYTSLFGIEQATGNQYVIGGPIHSVGGSGWSGVGRGNIYAGAGELLLGGSRDNVSNSGSRCALFLNPLSYSVWLISVRAAGDHLNLGQETR